jgi:SAM-dependent methyltransferase
VHSEHSRQFDEHLIQWDDRKVSRLWNYYSRTPPYSNIYFAKVFGDRLLKLSGLPLDLPLEVLDFGCGPGFVWEHLLALGAQWEYSGLDFSEESVSSAIAKSRGHKQFREVRHLTQLPAPWPAEKFDAVLLLEVVEHLNDDYLDGSLREASRLLKQGGTLVISTPNEEDLANSTKFCPDCGAIFHEWQHVRAWSVPSLVDKLRQYGFRFGQARMLDVEATSPLRRVALFFRRALLGTKSRTHMVVTFVKD